MNDEQLAVIQHGAGPLQTLAQAGSGKTRAAVHRVARLVCEEGVPGDRIFMVTFSRKAADEMDQRVRHLGVSGVNCQTWHAFCLRVLREDATRYAQWTVDERDKAKALVKQAAGYKHVNWTGADITKIRRFIGVCKAMLIGPGRTERDMAAGVELAREEFEWSERDARLAMKVYQVSQQLIEDAQLLTFDDMLVFAHDHLLDEDNRQKWAGMFDYVITDEAQDNSLVQVRLQEMLARDHRNLMVVGDLAQAIYGFRGSRPEYLNDFQGSWSARRIAMCRNYRSGSAIVDAANDIIRPAAMRQPEDMVAARGGDAGRVVVMETELLEDEAAEVVSMARRELEGGRKGGDITILFRLNAQSRALEDAFLRARLPYRLIGGTNFYERKEVKDLLAYLRVASGRDQTGDADGVRRCINAPFRFLGAMFVERLMAYPRGTASWADCVRAVADYEHIQQRQRNSANEWALLVEWLETRIKNAADPEIVAQNAEVRDHAKPASLLNDIVKRTRYIEWLEKEEGEESIESSHAANVRELLRVAEKFETVVELLDYVDQNVRESEKMARKRDGNAVTMMSIHRSKGLEWPIVWVVGCNEDVLPHCKGDPEEERRLMYVAATRARDQLFISYVRQMAMRQGLRPMFRSSFLDGVRVTQNVAILPGGIVEERPLEEPDAPEPPAETEEAREVIAAGGWTVTRTGELVTAGTTSSCFIHGAYDGETCPQCRHLAGWTAGLSGVASE